MKNDKLVIQNRWGTHSSWMGTNEGCTDFIHIDMNVKSMMNYYTEISEPTISHVGS